MSQQTLLRTLINYLFAVARDWFNAWLSLLSHLWLAIATNAPAWLFNLFDYISEELKDRRIIFWMNRGYATCEFCDEWFEEDSYHFPMCSRCYHN